MNLRKKYSVETEKVAAEKKGTRSSLRVHVVRHDDDGTKERVGSYDRNYTAMYQTFWPFTQREKEYALISKDYTATAVIALPSCEVVAAEAHRSWGFCPVDFYVPGPDPEDDEPTIDRVGGQFGFVAGCVWGDDSSWKIQFIDLSQLSEGKIDRYDRFGYVELPGGFPASLSVPGTSVRLEHCIKVYAPHAAPPAPKRWTARILHEKSFDVAVGKQPKPDAAEISTDRAEHFFELVSSALSSKSSLDKADVIGAIRSQLLSDYEAFADGEHESC
ncbi:MAG: hypothetical protein M3Y87_35735 [Myxococcota bacterium]|nr:hypothetical protein [Myxococcota bacterium]